MIYIYKLNIPSTINTTNTCTIQIRIIITSKLVPYEQKDMKEYPTA